jgi:hypothetical protein
MVRQDQTTLHLMRVFGRFPPELKPNFVNLFAQAGAMAGSVSAKGSTFQPDQEWRRFWYAEYL